MRQIREEISLRFVPPRRLGGTTVEMMGLIAFDLCTKHKPTVEMMDNPVN